MECVMAYRVLILGDNAAREGSREPLAPASNWLSHRDAIRFARDWLAQFPDRPVRIVAGSVSVAYTYPNNEAF